MTQGFRLSRPDPPSSFRAADNLGEVILVINGGYHEQVETKDYGIKPAARVTVVMLTGRAAGSVYEDVMFFSGISSQFRDKPSGDVSLCRITKSGKATVFEPGSSYDEQIAMQWISTNGQRLEQLREGAVRNFREQAAQMLNGGQAPRPAPSPHFTPPGAQVSYDYEQPPLPYDPQPQRPAPQPQYAPQPTQAQPQYAPQPTQAQPLQTQHAPVTDEPWAPPPSHAQALIGRPQDPATPTQTGY